MIDHIESEEHGCNKSEADQLAELMSAQEYADKQVLRRVRRGETTSLDFFYLCGRLNYNVDEV